MYTYDENTAAQSVVCEEQNTGYSDHGYRESLVRLSFCSILKKISFMPLISLHQYLTERKIRREIPSILYHYKNITNTVI